MAKAIMIQGTASNVGKSIIATALCRIFSLDGYKVSPFKSQNISNISYTTKDGLLMSKAQKLQAEAAFKEPDVRMNPILIKSKDCIIFNGVPLENGFNDFYKIKDKLFCDVKKSYASLAAENDIIVIEGAGSATELNLKQNDIVNMAVAKMAKSPVILVGDINRGGVFASLYGTIMLHTEDERRHIKGTIINKFIGDLKSFEPAIDIIENLTLVPVVGVVPYTNINIEPEDVLSEKNMIYQNDFDGLANHFRKALDIKLLYKILEDGINE